MRGKIAETNDQLVIPHATLSDLEDDGLCDSPKPCGLLYPRYDCRYGNGVKGIVHQPAEDHGGGDVRRGFGRGDRSERAGAIKWYCNGEES